MSYDEYVNEWNGRQVTRFGGQCVGGVAEFEAENNLPIVWGDAHAWINNPIMLATYDWTDNNPGDPNQLPNRGDIVVWPLPNEHIAFFDHNLDNHQLMSFGQNSGGPTMHFQPHPWANAAGWYSLKQVAPAEAPPVVRPYTIEQIPTKQVKLNKDTHLWDLNQDNFTAIDANPQADAIAGTLITVNALLHHNIGYNYYLPDPNVACGYNVLDCDDYTPPPPAPPAGQLPFPSSETYDVVVELPGYTTSNSAINHIGPNATVPAGNYSVFNKRFDNNDPTKLLSVNVTKTNGMAGAWINVADNVETPPEPPAPPEPEIEAEPELPAVPNDPAFAGTYKQWPEPEIYVAMANVPVVDLAGTKTVTMPQYSVTKVAGTFVVNGVEYARPLSAAQKDMWYGIRFTDPQTGLPDIELESVVYNSKTTIAERQVTHTLKTEDKLALLVSHLRNAYLSFVSLLGKIKPDTKNKK